MENLKILALIPARGGSKGIPRKNVRVFAGKPLIAHAIAAAKGAPRVDRIVVTTDDEEIAAVAREHGAEVPVMRPAEMAGDTSPVMDAVIHMLDHLKNEDGYEPTHVLLLQTTSPMRESADIERCIDRLLEAGGDALVSVCRTENGLFAVKDDGVLETLYDGYAAGTNRQALPKTYKLDGCMLYLIKTDVLRRERSFLGGTVIGYPIERWRTLDLDEPEDFVLAELVYAHKDEIAKRIKDFP